MKGFSKKKAAPSGRQRLRSDDLVSKPVSKTFAYRSQRSDTGLNTGRQLQREAIKESAAKGLRFGLQRFGMIILLLVALVSLANVLTLNTNAKIVTLSDGGGVAVRPDADYQKYADQLLAGSVWNRNKVAIDTAAISSQMLDRFPELASVSVTVPLLAHRPIIYVQPAQPALLLTASNGAFLLSDSGKALLQASAPADLNQPSLPVLVDQSGLKLELGRQALPAASVSFIRTVVAQMAAKQMTITTMTLPANASELDVQPTGQPYTVKFNLHSSKAREEVGTYMATLAYLQKTNAVPAKYIDVRVDGRAYYQ
jgi:hypothetical protein